MYYTAYKHSTMSAGTPSNSTSNHRAAAPREDHFLVALGKRVRELRNRRGMTRRAAARAADVSERHLAQLEVGEGNVSVVLLQCM
jgi:XRE family aerobic/anaerobic benzoate catabolism transcriptional regulator